LPERRSLRHPQGAATSPRLPASSPCQVPRRASVEISSSSHDRPEPCDEACAFDDCIATPAQPPTVLRSPSDVLARRTDPPPASLSLSLSSFSRSSLSLLSLSLSVFLSSICAFVRGTKPRGCRDQEVVRLLTSLCTTWPRPQVNLYDVTQACPKSSALTVSSHPGPAPERRDVTLSPANPRRVLRPVKPSKCGTVYVCARVREIFCWAAAEMWHPSSLWLEKNARLSLQWACIGFYAQFAFDGM